MTHPGDPTAAFGCPEYGGCPAAGLRVGVPSAYAPSTGSDHHGVIIDPATLKGEVDGWGGYGCSGSLSPVAPSGSCLHPCDYEPAQSLLNCSFGGAALFSGNGLGAGGNAAGYAFGLMTVTAGDLLSGHIDHALGIGQSCLDNGGVYPAGVGRSTDATCPANLEPTAVYGDMIHLKSSVNVASLGYGRYCTEVAQALQKYGAYTDDNNGSYGISIDFEIPTNPQYGASNPWPSIYASMIADGDAVGSAGSVTFASCLQKIPAADIEVVQIANGS